MTDKIHDILHHWFGDDGSADLPSSDRTGLWFGESDHLKEKMATLFRPEYDLAIADQLPEWKKTPRGCLALIILLDQFSRFMHQHSAEAFAHDEQARALCVEGLKKHMDRSLTLIERVFFYIPFVHAEDAKLQEEAIQLFQQLVTLSLPETTPVYQLFLSYAYAHFRVIKEFGRFPQRNAVFGRTSTSAEAAFLKNV